MNGRLFGLLFVLMTQAECLRAQSQADCGARCLFVAAHSLDETVPVTFEELLKRLPAEKDGVSLSQLQEQATALNFHTLAVQTSLPALNDRQRPFACIAHLKRRHFVLITKYDGQTVTISDPPESYTLPAATFLTEWDGHALLLARTALVPEETIVSAKWWRDVGKQCSIWGGVLLAVTGCVVTIRNKLWRKSGV